MTDDNVAHLPARAMPRQPHVFGDFKRVYADASPSGYEQTERTCKNCGAVRITILTKDGAPLRAWRGPDDAKQVITEVAPLCPQTARAP